MPEPAIAGSLVPYDLAGNWCAECGRPKSLRLMYDGLETGCKACDEVTTRHRCTGCPDISDLEDGQSWECGDCGSTWTPGTVAEDCPDCCAGCGHQVSARRWSCVPGDRLDSAPRYISPHSGWWPMRNLVSSPRRAREPGACHVTASGVSVHVSPGCRCPRPGRRS